MEKSLEKLTNTDWKIEAEGDILGCFVPHLRDWKLALN